MICRMPCEAHHQSAASTNDLRLLACCRNDRLDMFFMVEGGGFEPPKSSDDRFTVCSLWPLGNPSREDSTLVAGGAGDGTRTRNLLITSQLLCQLSYASVNFLYT